MVWGLNNKFEKQKVIISLTENEVRLFLVENISNNINVLGSNSAPYNSLEQLNDVCLKWIQSCKSKGLNCYWLLSRKLYKTISVVPPKVPESEIDGAIKWLVKDQVEQSLDDLLVSHYTPFTADQEPKKLTAVIVEKELVEKLIEVTDNASLNLASIEINELTAGQAMASELQPNNIAGLIDEDNQGLIYNFYVGKKLAFTRHIKGRFFPKQQDQDFTLDSDDTDTYNHDEAQTDQFLLETQRTLDYCVSQIFRKPVNALIIDASKIAGSNLKDSLEQITELPVHAFTINSSLEEALQKSNDENRLVTILSIAEAGLVLQQPDKKGQQANLYLPQYHPKPLEFGFKFAASIAALFFFGFITYGMIQEKELHAARQQLVIENETLSKVQVSLLGINKTLGKDNSSNNLNNLIIRRQKELMASKQLLSQVNNKSPDKAVSYSKILAALSRQKTDSLWLTQINLSPSSINLRGQTTKPKSIPSYINNMAKNQTLSSQFEGLTIERDETDSRLVNFTMSNGMYSYGELNNAH